MGYNIFLNNLHLFITSDLWENDQTNVIYIICKIDRVSPLCLLSQKKLQMQCNILQVWADLLDYFVSLLSTLGSNKQH
jgi:hypothetical protein